MALHDNEFRIDPVLVRQLLSEQMPEWADLPITRLETSGTVNVAYRLGDDMLVRLPRTASFSRGPQRESRWLPVFAPRVPLEVPSYLALGRPTELYPSHWSVLRWIEGTTAGSSTLHDLDEAASALAEFVVALRRVATDGAPEDGNYRAFGLARADRDLRDWADRLPDDIDASAVLDVWESCLSVGEWNGSPTWLHSDLKGDNLIAHNGSLVAVIDWEGCTVGDPSADYLAAWWLFDGDSREVFRTATNAEHADWQRAKGWALHMAVVAIPYYSDTNPAFATQARSALAEILTDE
ncbi:MAG: aminoglycoside phosphotransferase family protein [Actinomycetota bacterium]